MDDAARDLFSFAKPEDTAVQPKKKAKAAPKPSAPPPPPSSGPAATTGPPSTATRGEPKAKRSRRTPKTSNGNGAGSNSVQSQNNTTDGATPSAPTSNKQEVQPTIPAAPVTPKLEVPLISFAELMAFPEDGGVAAVAKAGSTKSGQGKRSVEEMRIEDNTFLAERRGELRSLGDFTKIPAEEMLAYCTAKGRVAAGCVSKCNLKLTALKRRKDISCIDSSYDFQRVLRTASIFQALYTNLSHESGSGAVLADVMKILEADGYKFANVVHIKQVNGVMLEHLRFGQFPKLVAAFDSSSEAMVRLSALDSAESEGILEEERSTVLFTVKLSVIS